MSQYATIADLKLLGLPPEAIEEIEADVLNAHLQAESSLADSYLGARYTLPLIAPYPDSLKLAVVYLTVCSLLLRRGYNPETYDTQYAERCKWALEWLKGIATGTSPLPGVIPTGATALLPLVYTKPQRGWTD